MIRNTTKYLTMAAMISFAAYGNAATKAVTPSFAACSKALVESIVQSDELPAYSMKAPVGRVSTMVDPDSYTVFAHDTKKRTLLAKATCKATPDGEIVSFKTIPVKS